MSKSIVIIQGHPDPQASHFGHALVEAYVNGARAAGHRVHEIRVAALEFPLLRSQADWNETAPPDILAAQQAVAAAEHLVVIYPLWLGDMPALLKGFLEQLFRPGFAFEADRMWPRKLKGRSARVIVTTGMPGFAYRWFFLAHSLKSLKRNVLQFVGIQPVATTVIGNVEGMGDTGRRKWCERMTALGRRAA